ncbi:hypothetical protein TWF281_001020 [Arthrobotrys megalospora]
MLPFELYGDIIQYLDKESTKSLRLAYPSPKILATTSLSLFETLVLRLGNHRNSRSILERLRSCLLTTNDGDLSTNVILANVRTLVVDTRYPFEVTDEFISTRPKWRGSDGDITLVDFANDVPDEEIASFLDLLKRVFSAVSGRLRSLKWQTSDFLVLETYNEIAKLLCPPATQGKYELTISHTFSQPWVLTEYLQPLSNCHRLEIVGQYIQKDTDVESADMAAVTDLIQRSNQLKSLSFACEAWMEDGAVDILWEAINRISTLEELKIQASECCAIGSVKPSLSSKRLKYLSLIFFDYDFSAIGYDPVKTFWPPSTDTGSGGHQGLTKLAIGVYPISTKKLVLQQQGLTDLRLHVRTKEDALEVWGIIVPAVAKTLRRFKLTGCTGGQPWGWSQTASYARALLKCKNLEEVEVPFIERDWRLSDDKSVINSLPTLIHEFVQNCPKLFRIYTGDIVADYNVSCSLLNVLKGFKSTDGCFRGRGVEVVLRRYTPGEWAGSRSKTRFPRSGDGEDMVGVFDYYIHRWRLKEVYNGRTDKTYIFQRAEDDCWLRNECWEDD